VRQASIGESSVINVRFGARHCLCAKKTKYIARREIDVTDGAES
jgi:hypothetical protein